MRSAPTVFLISAISVSLLSADAFVQPRAAHAQPTVVFTDPDEGAEVPASTGITIVFSEPVTIIGDEQTDWFTLECTVSSDLDPTGDSGDGGTTWQVGHDGFTPGEECTFTVLAAAVEDEDGVNMLADYSFTFTVEVTPPTVVFTDPDEGAEVPASTGITIVFSEPVTIIGDEQTDWFTLECTVSPDLDPTGDSGDGGTTWQVGHDGFTPGEECTFTVLAAAVEDEDGVTMLADYSFTFTIEDVAVGCVSSPRTGCLAAGKARLELKRSSEPERNQLSWKWQRGDAFEQDDLGMPTTTTSYSLCIYDQTASVVASVGGLLVDPNPAWTSKDPKGWSYKDKSGAEDGVQKVKVKTGPATKTLVRLKAKGVNLTLPVPIGGGVYFDQDPSVVVQLVNSEGTCWTTEFTSATTNSDVHFKAKME